MNSYLHIKELKIGNRFDDFTKQTKIPIEKLTNTYLYIKEEYIMTNNLFGFNEYYVSTNKRICKYKREFINKNFIYHELEKNEASILQINIENEDGTFINYISEKECIDQLKRDLETRLSLYYKMYENIKESLNSL